MAITVKFRENEKPEFTPLPTVKPKPVSRKQNPSGDKIKNVLEELDNLIGLEDVKGLVWEISAFVEIQKKRAREKLNSQPTVMHMVFKGNPGTGKTTVARIIGKLFRELGILQKGHVIEIERADLVGEYIGQTAQKTKAQIKKAQGGVLFIDEAYSLARGGEKDFGKEAVDSLVKGMEDHKDNLILILAGYKEEMDTFMQTNPGLRSRFPIQVDFPDYREEELLEIGEQMLKERQYYLSQEGKEYLKHLIKDKVVFGHRYNGNARMMRNVIERSIRRQAVRLVERQSITRDELMIIEREDLVE
ncbi:stage V sporulation protein K [Desulfitispora alkaliphila]|uniref:AAA family ATPase n=1 Tax=Desulfitispora alkaliphila TaxID=622674 RepID=UPI003D25A674